VAGLLQDLRYALRVLRKAPAFTAVAILTLALGIGTTTVVFSVVEKAMLTELPYPRSAELVHLDWRSASRHRQTDSLNARQALFVEDNNTVFGSLAETFYSPGCNLVGGGRSEYVSQAAVSTGFFRTFGVRPVLGRTFLPADAPAAGPAQVAVVSYALWRDELGGDPQAVGRSIKCNGLPYTVVGVLPATFSFPEQPADVWVPDRMQNYASDNGENYWVVGRIKPGLDIGRAQEQMTLLSARFRSEFPRSFTWTDWIGPDGGVHLVPLRDWRLGGRDRTTLLLLFGAVSLVLLIAAANVAGLILARASGRTRELAARLALGATRARLARQLLTEAVCLSLAGGGVGLLLAGGSLRLLNAVLERFPQIGAARIDPRVALFALAVSLLAAVLAGIAPALHVTRIDLQQALKLGERGSPSASQHRLRRALVTAEVALALLLLVGSSLLARSFLMLREVSPGFDPRGISVAELSFGSVRYQTSAGVSAFQRDLLARLRAVPGMAAAATVSSIPLRRDLNLAMKDGPCSDTSISYRAISAGYFAVMGIPLHRGRAFGEGEAAPVAIVNETLARRCWPGQDPLSTRLAMSWDVSRQIVGVVGDTRDYGLKAPATPIVWVPQWQEPDRIVRYQNAVFHWSLVFRAAPSAGLNRAVGRAVHDVDPEQSVVRVVPLSRILAAWLAPSRLLMELMGLFAGLALLLTAVGLYGVLSYYVTQRSREIGIRMALGAARAEVLREVLAEGAVLVGVGAAIGVLGSLALTRLLSSVLFGVKPLDPLTFAAALGFLVLVALLAGYLPARRATLVDPIVVLRYE
jgi:putative ABC transport system permease protein